MYAFQITYFFMACLVLNACSFCVAGDMISSEGETYCWSLNVVYLVGRNMLAVSALLTARIACAIARLDGGVRGSLTCLSVERA
jgi:hypothetical protein